MLPYVTWYAKSLLNSLLSMRSDELYPHHKVRFLIAKCEWKQQPSFEVKDHKICFIFQF